MTGLWYHHRLHPRRRCFYLRLLVLVYYLPIAIAVQLVPALANMTQAPRDGQHSIDPEHCSRSISRRPETTPR